MLQAIFNQVLQLDPNAAQNLHKLAGKNLAIICSNPAHNLYVTFENNKVLFASSIPAHIDLTISGTLQDFVSFAISKERSQLQISGDIMVASLVEKLYSQLDIDWENELSQHTGDIFAHQALQCFKTLKNYTQTSMDSFSTMLVEYLQNDADILPTPIEVEQFMHEIDLLRLQVDRLEARIKAYEST